MKKYFLGIFAILLTLWSSSFSPKQAFKPFVSVTFYYNDCAPYQRIECTFCVGPIIRRSIICDGGASFRNTSNWSTTPNSAVPYTSGDGSSFVDSITISVFDTDCDGNDYDGICLQEALDAIYNYYSSGGCNYPASL